MKIKTKDNQDEKADCCNNYTDILYQLEGWDKDDWICADCFLCELIDNDYEVIPNKS